MCLIVSGKGNKFIAKKDFIVYKQLEESSCGYVTPCQDFPVKLNSEIVPKGKIELRSYGSKQCLDRGAIHAYAIIPVPGIYFEAIIKKGTEFWIQDNLTQIAAEKLYITSELAGKEETDLSEYIKEFGVDVYLKDGRRCKITDSFDKKDVIGVYGYDNQVIALESIGLPLSDYYQLPGHPKVIDDLSEAKKDLDGYGNTKQLKALGIKSDALDYCEKLGKDWYIPSLGQVKLVAENMLRINLTLKHLGKDTLPFSWFWSSTLESSKYAWGCFSSGRYWYGGFNCNHVGYCFCVLPFLELS